MVQYQKSCLPQAIIIKLNSFTIANISLSLQIRISLEFHPTSFFLLDLLPDGKEKEKQFKMMMDRTTTTKSGKGKSVYHSNDNGSDHKTSKLLNHASTQFTKSISKMATHSFSFFILF